MDKGLKYFPNPPMLFCVFGLHSGLKCVTMNDIQRQMAMGGGLNEQRD